MKVTETDLATFIDEKVVLSEEKADGHRKQVNNLRERLEAYIKDHPDFELVKMLNSGSVAKGTALSLINDMDVAVYVRPDKISNYYQAEDRRGRSRDATHVLMATTL